MARASCGQIPHLADGGAAMAPAPRVLIADDTVDSCWLVAFVLRQDPYLALAGEATDGEMAVSLVRQERPEGARLVGRPVCARVGAQGPPPGGPVSSPPHQARVARDEGAGPHPPD